jgi:hypothetical protein
MSFTTEIRPPSCEDRVRGCYSASRLKDEVDKCDLLCSLCHAELHDLEYDQARKLDSFTAKPAVPVLQKECPVCNGVFKTKVGVKIHCSNTCRGMADRKAERPSKEGLQELLESTNYCAIGRLYGVSDKAVRKWAEKYGLLQNAYNGS